MKSEANPPVPDPFVTDEDEIAFLMEEVSRALRRAFERRIEATGLSRTQWRIIVYLLRTEGMTQTELARALELERATVGQAIDRLEQRGFIERRISPSDRRVWRIYTSGDVQRLVPDLRANADEIHKALWAGATRQEFEQFRITLRAMAERLAEALSD